MGEEIKHEESKWTWPWILVLVAAVLFIVFLLWVVWAGDTNIEGVNESEAVYTTVAETPLPYPNVPEGWDVETYQHMKVKLYRNGEYYGGNEHISRVLFKDGVECIIGGGYSNIHCDWSRKGKSK